MPMRDGARGATTVRAVSIAAPIARALESPACLRRVLAVHRRVVTIAAPSTPGGIIAIVDRAADDPGLPYGLVVEGFDALRSVARPGLDVTDLGVRVDCRARAVVPAALLPVEVAWEQIGGNVRLARRLASGAPTGAVEPFDRPIAAALGALEAAVAGHDAQRAVAAGRSIVGLGRGLTPTGDDVLIGFGAVLAATGDRDARSIMGGWAADARDRTTTVGAALLAHAARLEFARALRDVVGAVLGGTRDDVRMALAPALRWGATSGADTLTGVLAAASGLATGRRAEEAA